MYWCSTKQITTSLRPDNKSKPAYQTGDNALAESDALPEEEELWIACRNCHQLLTQPSQGTAVNGSHQHTFANPSGVVFEIRCFRSTKGCALTGPPSTDFTWFPGYSWQIAICSSCQTHLGWLFRSQGAGQFYGLIVDRLTELSGPA